MKQLETYSISSKNFGDLHGVEDFVSVYMLKVPIQNLESHNCGLLQMHFIENLFGANAESKMFEHKKLTKNTLGTSEQDFLLEHRK